MELTKLYRYRTEAEARNDYCLRQLRYLGITEGSTEHQQILDDYNALSRTGQGLPRGHKAVRSDDWCAIFAAGQAHAQKLTDIYPMECSCSKIIELARGMGIWIEDDGYIPVPGDWCIFAWKGPDGQENTLSPNHIGTVYHSDGQLIVTVEGNKGDAVAVRAFAVGDKRVRGYVHPDYTQLIGSLIEPPAVKQEPVEPVQPIYRHLEEVPEWGRATVDKLVGRGWLRGVGEEDLGLTEDLVRTLTVLDRAQVFEVGELPI